MKLKNLQKHFLESIYSNEAPELLEQIESSKALNAKDRIGIYRNSIHGNFISILKEDFKVCLELVGTQYFEALCRKYLNQYRDNQPDVMRYGQNFPIFLKSFKPVLDQIPYLPDMARLEWACHEALDAPDYPVFDPDQLKAFSNAEQARLVFKIPFGASLVKTSYPVLELFMAHQTKSKNLEEISLAGPPELLMVYRKDWSLCVKPLKEVEGLILTLLEKGEMFESVCSKIIEKYPDVNMAELLKHCILQGWIINFELQNQA